MDSGSWFDERKEPNQVTGEAFNSGKRSVCWWFSQLPETALRDSRITSGPRPTQSHRRHRPSAADRAQRRRRHSRDRRDDRQRIRRLLLCIRTALGICIHGGIRPATLGFGRETSDDCHEAFTGAAPAYGHAARADRPSGHRTVLSGNVYRHRPPGSCGYSGCCGSSN